MKKAKTAVSNEAKVTNQRSSEPEESWVL